MSDSARAAFITGFPGFIGRRLLARLREADPGATFYLLVQPRFVFEAEKACRVLQREHPDFADRWRVVVGDLRRPQLGISEAHFEQLRERVTDVWHLAAIYDLAVPQSVAFAVNVTGTERVLALCASAPNLRRFNYVSTCYVAGTREGRIYEDELDCGQEFKNHYESTKCWAEIKVQDAWDDIPTTIYRPSIVAGDSVTGETDKADGPYFMVQLLRFLPRWLPMVHFGESSAKFNVVPVDFVVEAMARLSTMPQAERTVFALADPVAVTARQFMDLTLQTMGRPGAIARVPTNLATFAMGVGLVKRTLPIPAESMTYLNHHAEFDVSNTARLLGDALHCPRVADYWPTLVGYACNHPEIFKEAVA
jgi:thioester reductase-like protein